MLEFLSLYAKVENPTVEMVILTFLLAFVCSSMIALTYYFSSPNTLKTANFIQSIILSSLVVAIILQSVGDSIGAGLGIMGALTIVNFRSSFQDPRDLIFMFAALGSGVACGSYVFTIGLLGTIFFCAIAISLRFTPFYTGQHQIWEIRMKSPLELNSREVIEKILDKHCTRWSLNIHRNTNLRDAVRYVERSYSVLLIDDVKYPEFLAELESHGLIISRFSKENTGFGDSDV